MNFNQFVKELEKYSSVAITAPAGADGDSVGTQSSMRELLLQIFPNKTIRIVNEEPCPKRYTLLAEAPRFEVSKNLLQEDPSSLPEAWICVDGGLSRIGPNTTELWNKAKWTAQIDHHVIGGTSSYDFQLYDPKAAATTEIVFKFAQALNLKITPTIAQAIYVGLVFDTGLFKHNNTKPETLMMAAELLKTGFDHTSTIEYAVLMKSDGALKMLRNLLNHMNVDEKGRYVWGVLSHKDFMAAGGDADDREGLIDSLFLVRGCEIAALYFERYPGDWKVSFRSRAWDVAALARSLNPEGGGHKLASGCTLKGDESEILSRAHKAVSEVLNSKVA